VGQEVEVRVRSIENLGRPDERIGLSLKDLQQDPWEKLVESLTPGSRIPAKVVRLADFGAFMEIAPGVDGLAHVSTLADHRVGHPSEILQVGQELEVWVISVDRASRRISLSVMDPAVRAERTSSRPPREEAWTGGEMPEAPKRDGGRRRDREGGRKRDRESRRDSWHDEGDSRSFRQDQGGMTSMQEAFQRMRERN
jgi:predicted RNA-binding protein with RPS1 domain